MKSWVSHLLTAIVFTAVGAFLASLLFGLRPDAGSRSVGSEQGRSRIRVEVLNGAGVDGLALRATDSLRSAGFDVVYYGNARSFDRERSVVLDRGGSLEKAVAVGQVLGIYNVRSEPNPDLYLDVTVMLGRDWIPDVPAFGAPPRPTRRPGSSGLWAWVRERVARFLAP